MDRIQRFGSKDLQVESKEFAELERRQRLLGLALFGLAGPSLIFSVVTTILWLLFDAPVVVPLAGFGMQPFYLVSYWLNRRGRVRLAGSVVVVMLFVVMVWASFQVGIGHATLAGYAMVTVVAGLLVGTNAALGFSIASMVAYLATGAAQVTGRLPGAVSPAETLIIDGVALAFGSAVLAIFNRHSDREARAMLRRERAFSIALRTQRAELQRHVTELEQAGEALTASHERFVAVLDGIDADVYVADIESYEVLFANQHMREGFGDHLVGRVCFEVFRGDSEPCAHCTNDRLVDVDGDPAGVCVWEGHNLVSDRWYVNHDRAVKWTGDRLVRLQVATDITSRKRAEAEQERLLEAEHEQRLLAETLREVTLALTSRTSRAAVLDEVLHQAQRIVPYQRANIALLEKDALRVARWHGYQVSESGDAMSQPLQPLADFALDAGVVASRKPLVTADTRQEPGWQVLEGSEWIRSHLSMPICSHDRVLGLLRLDSEVEGGFSVDDVDRLEPLVNAAAIALESAQLLSATRRQADQLEALRQVSQDLIALRDLDGLLDHIVDRALQLLNGKAGGIYLCRPDEQVLEWVVARGVGSVSVGTTLRRGEGLCGKVWETGEPLIIDDYHTWPGKSAKWNEYEAGSVVGVPIQWRDEFLGVLWVSADRSIGYRYAIDDATLLSHFAAQAAVAIDNARLYEVLQQELGERERAEAVLARQAQEMAYQTMELADSNKELEQFAYVASHDLQEPLRMVTSYLKLLERRCRGQLDEDADEFIHYAVDGATRMQLLINDLLAYSRVGTQARPMEPTDCSNLLIEVLANLEVAIAESETVVTSDRLPTVMVDSVRLTQVLQNLVGNAIKFRGEERPRVHVSARQEGDEWLFSIGNNGIGIEPRHADRIFEVFQRLHSREEYPGTGIGLAICKKVVTRHGGRIWVESEPGKGSIFYFTLPVMKEHDDE